MNNDNIEQNFEELGKKTKLLLKSKGNLLNDLIGLAVVVTAIVLFIALFVAFPIPVLIVTAIVLLS
jgi:hypothetical protein